MTATLLKRVKAEADERTLSRVWSFLYFFSLLCGYYMLWLVRDEIAIEDGVQHLPSVRRLRVLECHGGCVHSGTGAAFLQCDCRWWEHRSDGQAGADSRCHVCVDDSIVDVDHHTVAVGRWNPYPPT